MRGWACKIHEWTRVGKGVGGATPARAHITAAINTQCGPLLVHEMGRTELEAALQGYNQGVPTRLTDNSKATIDGHASQACHTLVCPSPFCSWVAVHSGKVFRVVLCVHVHNQKSKFW